MKDLTHKKSMLTVSKINFMLSRRTKNPKSSGITMNDSAGRPTLLNQKN